MTVRLTVKPTLNPTANHQPTDPSDKAHRIALVGLNLSANVGKVSALVAQLLTGVEACNLVDEFTTNANAIITGIKTLALESELKPGDGGIKTVIVNQAGIAANVMSTAVSRSASACYSIVTLPTYRSYDRKRWESLAADNCNKSLGSLAALALFFGTTIERVYSSDW